MKKNFFYAILCVTCISCTTQSSQESKGVTINHEAVDLGLSVLWATCNIGANTPEEYGDYFAWGETNPKNSYSWETYTYGDDYNDLTKYCADSVLGKDNFNDTLKILELSDDAAYINWGSEWRIPTYSQQKELLDSCKWEWTSIKNSEDSTKFVTGYKVTGPNGNHIFLPAAGYYHYSTLSDEGEYGRYWSSSLAADSISHSAYYLYFSTKDSTSQNLHHYYRRYYGRTIRPIFLKSQNVSIDITE